jgi:hypothetical protein
MARITARWVIATSLAFLVIGALAGWSARSPDVVAVPVEPALALPVLWLDPSWAAVPNESTPEEQLRYALFVAPRDEWVAAFLAVPGYFPRAHEPISKAYTQIARILHRRGDVDALVPLERELGRWKDAQQHDQELIELIRIAVKLRNGDLDAVVEGMKNLTRDEASSMYDPALVELGLEVCADAMFAATHSGAETILRETLQKCQARFIGQLYKIEVHRPARLPARAAGKQS